MTDRSTANARSAEGAGRELLAHVGRGLFLIAIGFLLLVIAFGMATAGVFLMFDGYFVTWLAALLTAASFSVLGLVFVLLGRRSTRKQTKPISTELATDVVRHHPLGTAAAALGAGLLLGFSENSRKPAGEPSR